MKQGRRIYLTQLKKKERQKQNRITELLKCNPIIITHNYNVVYMGTAFMSTTFHYKCVIEKSTVKVVVDSEKL